MEEDIRFNIDLGMSLEHMIEEMLITMNVVKRNILLG